MSDNKTTLEKLSERLSSGLFNTKPKEDNSLANAIKLKDDQIYKLTQQVTQLYQQMSLANSINKTEITKIKRDFELRLNELSVYIKSNKQKQDTIPKEQQIIKRKTHTILLLTPPVKASRTILTLKEKSGIIRELTVVSPVKFRFVINLDDEYILRDSATFDALSTISEFSDDIDAIITIDNNYLITIKNLQFTSSVSIVLELDYDKQGQVATNMKNIFCLYDTEE